MARVCSICSHPRVLGIDAALSEGRAYRSVARQFEASESSVYRHWKEHLPIASGSTLETRGDAVIESGPVAASRADRSSVRGPDLLDCMARIHNCSIGILEAASAAGRHETALKAIREIRGNIELTAKLEAQLGGGTFDLRNLTAESLQVFLRESVGGLSARDREALLLEEPELADLVSRSFGVPV